MNTPKADNTGGKQIEIQDRFVLIIRLNPTVTPERLDLATQDAEAVVLVVFASGALPDCLTPVIQRKISLGVPVFLLSNNPGDNHGILHPGRYAAGIGALEAGAIPLEKVNVNQAVDVEHAISQALDAGMKGAELAAHIQKQFAYGPDEEKPKAEWETPEGIAAQRERMRQTFRRQKMSPDEIEKELHRWEFEGFGS